MAKIVMDAHVLISAAFGGRPLEAVIRAMQKHEVYLSEANIRELEGVFEKLAKKLSREQIQFTQERVRQIVIMAHRIAVSTPVALSRDVKDDHYLSLCKEAVADYLITGDKDLLSINPESLKKNGITCRILTPNSFLEADDEN